MALLMATAAVLGTNSCHEGLEAHGLKDAAAEVVVPSRGEGRPSEDCHDLTIRENFVHRPEHAEFDPNLSARDGVADGLVTDVLAQPFVRRLGTPGLGG